MKEIGILLSGVFGVIFTATSCAYLILRVMETRYDPECIKKHITPQSSEVHYKAIKLICTK